MAGTELASAYVTLFPKLKTDGVEAQLRGIKADGAGAAAGNSFGSGFAGTLKTAAVAAAAVAAVAAAAALAKTMNDSLWAYADYEQLVGGVETLFKDSAGQVQAYASEAYRTAGISANEYMEQATSFSASLIQSLGGDTAAAAEYANMAITDMSDNANKMGSDITMIQNAYQGFAKQNFTMLDNLKLGYGGTQEEMKRLLADATAISGIEYDMSQYADVVEAIHVIQTEMGITGTTALEAAETISGSIATMKAKWNDWLVALADGNADLTEQTAQLVESVATVAANVVPRIGQIAQSVGTVLMEQLPIILDDLISYISANGVAMGEAALQFFGEITIALAKATPQILQALLLLLASLVVAVINKAVEMVSAGIELVKGIAQGIADGFWYVLDEIGRGIQEGVDKVRGYWNAFWNAGGHLISGLKAGITGAVRGLADAAANAAGAALNAAKSRLGIASPSKAFMEVGKFSMEGMALGIKSKASDAVNAAGTVAESVLDAASFSTSMSPAYATAGAGGSATYITLNCDIKDMQGIQTLNDLYDVLARARAVNPTRR